MIEWDVVAPMILGSIAVLTIGGVLVLRPIAKHLGAYLEALTRQHLEPGRQEEVYQLREHMETMSQRIHLLEERQDFSERLHEERSRKELPEG